MPLSAYGVLVGRVVACRRESAGEATPHYQVHVVADGVDYRVAVNVQSAQAPSQLRYLVDDDFAHPVTDDLAGLAEGWAPLPSQPGGASLDFIRGNLFDPAGLRLLPADLPGERNDLADLLDSYLLRAVEDPTATVFAFGQRWGPDPGNPDPTFGFSPGNGVHDIHMNQGNSTQFAGDDGVWQDGGLLIRFAGTPRWVAIFLAFQSQSWHTDDTTGHALDVEPAASVQVVAALVNPVGPSPEKESVTLLNTSPDEVDLTGWSFADRDKRRAPVPAVRLAAGEALRVPLQPPAQLGNKGGALTLLDRDGLKVHGVAYTAAAGPRGVDRRLLDRGDRAVCVTSDDERPLRRAARTGDHRSAGAGACALAPVSNAKGRWMWPRTGWGSPRLRCGISSVTWWVRAVPSPG